MPPQDRQRPHDKALEPSRSAESSHKQLPGSAEEMGHRGKGREGGREGEEGVQNTVWRGARRKVGEIRGRREMGRGRV